MILSNLALVNQNKSSTKTVTTSCIANSRTEFRKSVASEAIVNNKDEEQHNRK